MSKYSIISEKRRLQLIDLVKKDRKTIVSAAKKLKIKISTAKSILYSYEKNGKVLKKKKHQKTQLQRQEDEIQIIDQVENGQNSPLQQIKQEQVQKLQVNQINGSVYLNPFFVVNPQILQTQWNCYQYYQAMNQYPLLNGQIPFFTDN